MVFEIKGMKELQAKLNSLAELDGKKIPFVELFPPAFVASKSRFASIEELFDSSGFQVNSQEDLTAIPDDKWDDFISESTNFDNWAEMKKAAFEQWLTRQ